MLAKLFSILRQQTLGAIALFVVLGGTSFAVATGSIDSREIKNNTVRSKDIRNGTVRSRDVRNSSLLAQDFAPGQLPAGPRGLTGATGPRGAAGRDGFGRLEYPFDSVDSLANGQSTDLFADCPPGTFVTGGDAFAFDNVTGDPVGNEVIRNQLITDPTSYLAQFNNQLASGNDVFIEVDAICANANQVGVFSATRGKRRR